MPYFIVNSEMSRYEDHAPEAATAVDGPAWKRVHLANAIRQLEPGDELSVDSDISVFCITGKDIDYAG